MIKWKDLETERLRLREVIDNDKQSIFQLYSDKASSLLDDWEPMKHLDEADDKIRDMKDGFISKQEISFIITQKHTREFIGCCGMFDINEENSNCCLFIQIDKHYRNQGIATEAIHAITKYGMEDLKFHRMYAYITPGNDASLRVLSKCGYIREGILRDMEFYKDRYWDGIVMAIIEQDYFGM